MRVVILPVVFSGLLILGFVLTSVGDDSAGNNDADQQANHHDEEEGFGYVRALPEEAEPVLDPQEKEDAMERAVLMARAASGWEEGEMLAGDLQLLIASARSQLQVYEDELERMRRLDEVPEDTLEEMEEPHRRAARHLDDFEEVGNELRRAMIDLQTAHQRLGEGE